MSYDRNNIFARILRKEIPSVPVYEDEQVYAFLDIMPINPGHILVAPKEEAALLEDLSPEACSRLLTVGQKLVQALKAATGCSGVNLLVNDGPAAGQEVPHIHLHLIPRFEGDGFGLRYGPQGRPKRSGEELTNLAQKIAAEI